MTASAPLVANASLGVDDVSTLVGEHARLMRDVDRRATPVLALLSARVWPHAELGALTTVLRTAVLRQVSEGELLLFPNNGSAPPFAELGTDHLRLRRITAQLESARAEPCSRHELRSLVNELLDTLRRYLADEQQVLAALAIADFEVAAVAWHE